MMATTVLAQQGDPELALQMALSQRQSPSTRENLAPLLREAADRLSHRPQDTEEDGTQTMKMMGQNKKGEVYTRNVKVKMPSQIPKSPGFRNCGVKGLP